MNNPSFWLIRDIGLDIKWLSENLICHLIVQMKLEIIVFNSKLHVTILLSLSIYQNFNDDPFPKKKILIS